MLLANPDGSNSRGLPAGVPTGAFDWSPDGQWLLVSHDLKLDLVHVDSGLVLPLAWAFAIGQPSWRP